MSVVIAPNEQTATKRAERVLVPRLLRKHTCFPRGARVPVFVIAFPCVDPDTCSMMAPVIWGVRNALELVRRGADQ